MMDIPWGIIAPLIILQLILMLTAIISCVKDEKPISEKWIWVLIIVCISIIGPILYFIIGRNSQRD